MIIFIFIITAFENVLSKNVDNSFFSIKVILKKTNNDGKRNVVILVIMSH